MIDPSSAPAAEDFGSTRDQRRTRAAVALLVDQSFSMVMNDTWRTRETTAMALHALATTQFPLDAVEIIAFTNLARADQTAASAPTSTPTTCRARNLRHALMLAGRFLDKHPDAEPWSSSSPTAEPGPTSTRRR